MIFGSIDHSFMFTYFFFSSLLKTVLKNEPQLPLKMIMRSENLIGQNTGRPALSMATAAGGGSTSNMGNTESYMVYKALFLLFALLHIVSEFDKVFKSYVYHICCF